MTLGKRIRELRDDRDWSQSRLSRQADITEQTIHNIEVGRHTNTRLSTLTQLAYAFDMTVSELLEPVNPQHEGVTDNE